MMTAENGISHNINSFKNEMVICLKDENKRLEEQNKLKNEYLKRVVGR